MDGNIKPLSYDLVFEPDLKTFKFAGKEKIRLKILRATDTLVLNAADLKVRHCHLILQNRSVKPKKVELDEKNELLVLKCEHRIAGDAELFIDFEGTLNDHLAGFYRSRYEVRGREKFLATTQFEASDISYSDIRGSIFRNRIFKSN